MTIAKEIALKDFKFWGGAKTLAERLTKEELESLDQDLEMYFNEDLYEERMLTETRLNDLFWFDQNYIIALLRGVDIDDEEAVNECLNEILTRDPR